MHFCFHFDLLYNALIHYQWKLTLYFDSCQNELRHLNDGISQWYAGTMEVDILSLYNGDCLCRNTCNCNFDNTRKGHKF